MADSVIKAGIQISADVAGSEQINQLSSTIKQAAGETSELTAQAEKLEQQWREAQANQALITHYRSLKSALADNRTEITQTEQQMRQLAAQMQNGATKEQSKQYQQLEQQLTQLNQQKRQLLTTLRETNTQMNQVGINTKNLAEKQKQFAEQANKAETELKQLNQEAQKLQQITQAKVILGLDVDDRARQEINQLNQAYNDLKRNGGLTKAELTRATQAYQARLQELNTTLDQSGHKMTPMAQSIGKIGLAAAGAVGGLATLQKGLSDVLAATQEYQAIATRFTYAFGGAEEGAKQLAFVRDEANRLGLEMMGAANGYAQFAAAAKDLNISTEQTQSIFKGVASAAATMGLSADDANGVFLALSQIAGKGKVSMEELRGQLGERLAPAMSIAAQAMGVTTAELEKMVENGLAAETFLPRFGAALEQAFGADAATNVESLSGQINLLKNSYNEFLIKLGEGGVGQATITVLKDIGAALEIAQAKFDEFMKSEDGLLLQQSLSQMWDLLKQIGTTIVNVFRIAQDNFSDFSGIWTESGREIGIVQSLLMGVNLTVATLHDGFQGVGIVINLLSGAAKSLMSSMLNTMSKFTFGSWKAKLKQESQEMREEAKKNYQAAHESAMNFESQIGKTIDQMSQNANEVQKVYDNANAAAKASIDETAKAEAKAQELSQAYKDAQTAASSFGLDMRAAMNEPTPAIAEMLSNLDKLVLGFDDLKQQGVNAGVLIQQAVGKMIDSAANQADIESVKARIQSLGEAGKLSAEAVASAVLAADAKMAQIAESTSPVAAAFKQLGVESHATIELQYRQAELALQTIERSGQASTQALEQARNKVQELKNALDPTAAAFDRLGIKTKEALAQAAQQQMADFEKVKQSGQATQADLARAFAQTAQAAIASGDQSAMAWVQSQAAAYQYKVVVDETGKANLQAANQTVQAAATQTAAHQQVAAAAKQAAAAQVDSQTQVADATEKTAESTQSVARKVSELGHTIATLFKRSAGGISGYLQAYGAAKRAHHDLNKQMRELNDSTETGINLSDNLAKMQGLVSRHADALNKTSLSKFHAAIDKARQKLRQMADEAANTKKALEKQLLNAQGNASAVAEMEQREAIDALQKQLDAAKKMGNDKAAADYQQSIELQKRIYETELNRQRAEAEQAKREAAEAEAAEIKAKQDAERAQREQAQRESTSRVQNITLPEFKLPEPQLDLSAIDLSNVQIDTSAISDALAQRDSANLAQIKEQLPQLINDLIPQIAQKLIEQMQKDFKRGI